MSCPDIPDWFLRRRIPVIDLRSRVWQEARTELLTAGYTPAVCLARLRSAGRVRQLAPGLYVVVDPVRETPSIAIASAIYSTADHYVTTDAALTVEGLLDQPLPTIRVVLPTVRRNRLELGHTIVRPVYLAPAKFAKADAFDTTIDGFRVRMATRAQAVVDAVAEPHWMTHGSLLPEVLAAFSEDDFERAAAGALARSKAAAQRLGYLIEEAARPVPPSLAALRPQSVVELRPGRRSGLFSTRWRVYG
jgi:predicted transcriptional regulator of viral defense system